MNSYGLQALHTMYNGQNKMEKQNQELAQLQALAEGQKKKIADKKQAAMEMELYEAQISQFADNLLAPDRNAIYEKARLLKGNIRDHIKNTGGSYKSFMDNGGHQILGDYKRAIVTSPESSQYLENKKNMEMVLKMLQEGKGHLISPTDRANFDNYISNGGGKISYSGTKGEIKLPNLDRFKNGEAVPTEIILDENMAVILNNYAIHHRGTDKDPAISGQLPSRAELLAYTAMEYGSLTGSNTDNTFKKNQESLAWNKEYREQVSQPYNEEALHLANQQAKANVDQANLNLMQTEATMTASDVVSAATGSGITTGKEPEEPKTTYSIFTGLSAILNDIDADPTNVDAQFRKMMKQNNAYNNLVGQQVNTAIKQNNLTGTAFADIGFGDSGYFTPVSAYKLFKDEGTRSIFNNGTIKYLFGKDVVDGKFDWKVNKSLTGVYNADGTPVSSNHKSLRDNSDYSKDYAGEYQIVDTMLVSTMQAPDGKRIVVDKNENGKRIRQDVAYQKGNKVGMTPMILVKGPNGQHFYIEADQNNRGLVEYLHKGMDVTESVKSANQTKGLNEVHKATVKQAKREAEENMHSIGRNPAFSAAASQVAPNGNYRGRTERLFKAYYVTLKTALPNMSYDDIVSNTSNDLLQLLKSAEVNGILSRSQGNRTEDIQIFDKLMEAANSPTQKRMIETWKQVYFNEL